MPAEDLYNDGPADAAPEPEAADPDEDSGDSKTSILPRSFFANDVKPGDKASITVVAVHDTDVEVEPADTEQDEPDEQEAPEAEIPDGGPMQSMME